MFTMLEKYIHEVISTASGLVLIDVTKTPDCGWEGAYARLDEELFAEQWAEGGDEPYTMTDIIEWGEEVGAFDNWHVTGTHHKTPTAALKKLMKELEAE